MKLQLLPMLIRNAFWTMVCLCLYTQFANAQSHFEVNGEIYRELTIGIQVVNSPPGFPVHVRFRAGASAEYVLRRNNQYIDSRHLDSSEWTEWILPPIGGVYHIDVAGDFTAPPRILVNYVRV